MSDVKLQRIIARFQAKIDAGSYYEAHQTLRTITNRYVKSNQYPEAIDLLYRGASDLAAKHEYALALDLITYLIGTYEEGGVECSFDKSAKLKLLELLNLIPSTETSLIDLAKQSVSWSTKGSASKFGDADIHHLFGVKLLLAIQDDPSKDSEKNTQKKTEEDKYKLFTIAELHLILGTRESLPFYIDFLYQWYVEAREAAGTSKIVDPGVFLARGIINYLYLKNTKFANEALARFLGLLVTNKEDDTAVHQVIDNGADFTFYDFKNFELMNFLQLLVLTLQKLPQDAGSKFMKLYQQNKALLTQYEVLGAVEYLGRFYFNLQIGNPNGNQNMLANLMGGLFK